MKANLSIILTPHEVYHGRSFPANTVILRFESGTEFFCSDFKPKKKPVLIWTGKAWYKTEMHNNYTYIMYKYAKEHVKAKPKHLNVSQLMKASRKKKSGSGGARREFVGSITDYECTKNPLHDFRRVYV